MSITDYCNCPNCGKSELTATSTMWICASCRSEFSCHHGIPGLYIENQVSLHDRSLRDKFYDGVFGVWYSFMMPFIVLPVRPVSMAITHWALLLALLFGVPALVFMVYLYWHGYHSIQAVTATIPLAMLTIFLFKQKYLFYLIVLAIPVKISLSINKYIPKASFSDVHTKFIDVIRESSTTKLRILDVSTGSCNSLYKHGWMELDASYTGVDLSGTMLRKGQELMSDRKIPVDLILGDAMRLPFASNTFDVVLNYGAINGMAEPAKALSEMVRVAKPGGRILFLDEQMYVQASAVEKLYFNKVLSGHNVIHHCPVEFLPNNVADVEVSQIYEFYYICTARKTH